MSKIFSFIMRFYAYFTPVLLAACDQNTPPFIVITIPKSGTHLLDHLVYRLTNKQFIISYPGKNKFPWEECWILPIPKFERLTEPLGGLYLLTHLMYKEEYAAILAKKNCRTIFLYRDPRDQIISAYFYLKGHQKWPAHFFSEDINEFIFDMIDKKEISDPYRSTQGIFDFYSQYLPWLSTQGVYSVQFEDLVGPNGGGSQERQERVIAEIATHLGVALTNDELSSIAGSLFGQSITFRSGKVGSWIEYFNENHKKAFKKRAGQLLINLGYEKDYNW